MQVFVSVSLNTKHESPLDCSDLTSMFIYRKIESRLPVNKDDVK